MNTHALVNKWLQETGESLGFDFRLDSNGVCYIEHQDGLIGVIEVPENSRNYHFYSPIIEAPEDLGEMITLMRWALQLNLYQAQLQGGTLGYSESNNSFVLSYVYSAENSNLEYFQDRLALFFQIAERMHSAMNESLTNYRSSAKALA